MAVWSKSVLVVSTSAVTHAISTKTCTNCSQSECTGCALIVQKWPFVFFSLTEADSVEEGKTRLNSAKLGKTRKKKTL